MENSEYLSLKTRRILVIVFFITLIIPFAMIILIEEKPPTSPFWLLPLTFIIINGLIAYYLKSKSAVFYVGGHYSELDERYNLVRLKAQRDAYYFITISVGIFLPLGSIFFKDDINLYAVFLSCYIMLLSTYLPIMLIAWQEKEV